MHIRKGDWALVTGASSGIGKAFAEELARQGVHLIAVALEQDLLSTLCMQWEQNYGVQAVPKAIDLSEADFLEKVERETAKKNIDIAVLINAAGFGYFGDFSAMSHEQISKMVRLDVLSLIQLCRLFFPKMKIARRGAIVNIASIAGCLPYPYAAVYSGAKSFVHFFTQALWAENQEKDICIMSLCPGHAKTNFDKVSTEPDSIHLFRSEEPAQIARKTIAQFSNRRCVIYTKPLHPLRVMATKILPLKIFAAILNRLRRSGSGS